MKTKKEDFKVSIKDLPKGINEYQFVFCRHYAYLCKGMGLTNIIKYGVGLFGAGIVMQTGSSKIGIIALGVYAILCYFLGLFWYKFGFIFAEREVENQFDAFEREMRKMRDKLK